MIGYVTRGTNDLPRAAAFYDALPAEIAARSVCWISATRSRGDIAGSPSLGITKPYDGKPATVGNALMVRISATATATSSTHSSWPDPGAIRKR